jgi:hypothetical protein
MVERVKGWLRWVRYCQFWVEFKKDEKPIEYCRMKLKKCYCAGEYKYCHFYNSLPAVWFAGIREWFYGRWL